MKLSRPPFRFFPQMLLAGMMASSAIAQDALEHLKTTGEAEVAMVEAEGKLKKMDLAQKYATALGNLEKPLAASGGLDAIVHLRLEQESVRKTGEPTTHDDKPLVELRAKYLKSRDEIDAGTKSARAQIVQGTGKKIREQEAALTRAGKVEEALNLRKGGEQLLLQLSGGAAADSVGFADDPRAGALTTLNEVEMIKFPADNPPVVDNPFAIKGDWLTSMTIPVAKQKVREPIVVGHREKNIWVTVVVSPNSIWSGAERGKVHVAAGTFIATKSRFENLELGADHPNRFYFANCAFTNCKFPKVGWWHDGGWFFAKHYFENCYIKGSYAGSLTVQQNGIRAQTCVFEDVEFPTIRFNKHQPADFVNDKWLRLVNCRFVKCKLPLSFLLLTRDCVFENCVISEDIDRGDDAEITKPIQIDMYVSNTQIRVNKMPSAVVLNQKKYSDPKVATVPTAATLTQLMSK